MASLQEFESRIMATEGVSGYVLVKQDGNVLSHHLDRHQEVGAMVMLGGLCCKEVVSAMGYQRLKSCVLTLENSTKIYVFPVGRYLLGVLSESLRNGSTPVNDIREILKDFIVKH